MLPFLALLALWGPQSGAAAVVVPATSASHQDAEEALLIQLEEALASADAGQLVYALSCCARVRDVRVTRASTVALRNNNVGVRAAALDALRFNPHPRALLALHAVFKNPENLAGRDDLHALLLRATAQHADRSSLPILTKGGFTGDSPKVLSARILSLGKIRDKGSVEALMNAMKTLPPAVRLMHMDEFRLSLTQLTQVDHGVDARSWIEWWDAENESMHLRTDEQQVPASLQREWNGYWSRPAQIRMERLVTQTKRTAKPGKRKQGGKPVEASANPANKRERAARAQRQANQKQAGKGQRGEGAADETPRKGKANANAGAAREQRKNGAKRATGEGDAVGAESANDEQTRAPLTREERAARQKKRKERSKSTASGDEPAEGSATGDQPANRKQRNNQRDKTKAGDVPAEVDAEAAGDAPRNGKQKNTKRKKNRARPAEEGDPEGQAGQPKNGKHKKARTNKNKAKPADEGDNHGHDPHGQADEDGSSTGNSPDTGKQKGKSKQKNDRA